MAGNYARMLPTTGYWLFLCNTDLWNADEWFELGETELFYRVSPHHRFDMAAGQKGVLRINNDRRSLVRRKGRPKLALGIYAIFEVLGGAQFIEDPDRRANNSLDGTPNWRAPVRVLKNLFAKPVLEPTLPADPAFHYIRKPLHTTTIALLPAAFQKIVTLAGCPELAPGYRAADTSPTDLENSLSGIGALEQTLRNATPKQKRAISIRIERGRIGAAVKRLREGRCQICIGLGVDPVAFKTRRGQPYSEAHHVIPVSTLRHGSLSHTNIMVLCPNHHRQAHHGVIDVVEDMSDHWSLSIDGVSLRIAKLLLSEMDVTKVTSDRNISTLPNGLAGLVAR